MTGASLVARSADQNLNRLNDRRLSARRRDISLTTLVTLASGQDLCVRVLNIAATGIMFESAATHEVGQALTIELPGDISRSLRIRWNSGPFYGCQFDRPIPRWVVDSPLLTGVAGAVSATQAIGAAGISPEGTGYRIARLRKLRGWTQLDLAKALGVSKTTVCNWEREKCAPGHDLAARLWLALGEPDFPDEPALDEATGQQPDTQPDLAAVIHQCKVDLAQAAGINIEQVQITLLV
jgi:transcriptional regulator with XRE-family HTH domain